MRQQILKYIIFSLLLFAASTSLLANADGIEKASKAYQNKDYKQAITLYEEFIEKDYASADLYYNLGCAYFQNGDIAMAALNFERAYALNPSDVDIRYNIKIVESRLQDKVEKVPLVFYKRWYKSVVELFSLRVWAVICVLSFAILLFLVLVYLLSAVMKWRKLGFYAAVFMGIVFIFSLISCQGHYSLRNSDSYAIVFTPTVTTKSSPDEDSKSLFIIHEGLKVEITDSVGDWYEIELANGNVGWLLMSDVVII
jgi:tetratricopeptide (TPR) repeat protein